MKTSRLIKNRVAWGTMICLMVISLATAAMAAPRLYKMEGKITAIDIPDNTVVINVPITRNDIFTVAGPLAKNAVLKKDDKKATLGDFKVGERVIVEWTPTSQGHLIKKLMSR